MVDVRLLNTKTNVLDDLVRKILLLFNNEGGVRRGKRHLRSLVSLENHHVEKIEEA